MAGLHSAPGREVYLFKFVSKNISNLPETEKEVLLGITEGIERGTLLHKVPQKGPGVLIFFSLTSALS